MGVLSGGAAKISNKATRGMGEEKIKKPPAGIQ